MLFFFINKKSGPKGRFFSRCHHLRLNNKLLSDSVNSNRLNNLNGLLSSSVLAALFLAALVAAAHSSECYSYDKKHLFHKFLKHF